ncbi:LSU ribosomal protein L25P [Marininema mesophilum]|uniref:Large ribosomal subunit protein bL25 n=1 Tax=Marininema mesophilum TaxID=1048340 RepID=A0A1H2X078_9BACL|nr:50S ribosomal protein L25/general stress protein Ctc [Marininema mesophilum]SDW86201.1 LSU ribosomal protein L25P [Marininema mesophilum]
MAQQFAVERRESRPRSVLTMLRQEGRVPGVLYGKDQENATIHMEMSELIRLLQKQGTTSVIDLELDGKTHNVMISEIQRDRLKDRITHVDFKIVNMKEPIDTEVSIHLEGEAAGIKEDGILQQQARMVEIRCLPENIPDWLTMDISELAIGDSVTMADLKIPAKVELLSDPEEVIASILPPQVEQEAEAEALDEAVADDANKDEEPEAEAESQDDETKEE